MAVVCLLPILLILDTIHWMAFNQSIGWPQNIDHFILAAFSSPPSLVT